MLQARSSVENVPEVFWKYSALPEARSYEHLSAPGMYGAAKSGGIFLGKTKMEKFSHSVDLWGYGNCKILKKINLWRHFSST